MTTNMIARAVNMGVAETSGPHPGQPVPEVLVVDAVLPQIPPLVLARVAEQASALAEQALHELEGRPAAAQLGRARALMRSLARTGLQAQRCARVLGGDYLPVREQIALDTAVNAAVTGLARRHAPAHLRTHDLHAVSVWMEPAVLELLLELALDWALACSQDVDVRMAFGSATLHPDLVISLRGLAGVAQGSAPDAEGAALDTVSWQLLRLLAQSQGLEPQRLVEGDTATLVLPLPAGVDARPGEAGGVAAPAPHLAPGAVGGGCHVVVVERDDNLRLLMRELLHDAGVNVEVFVSPRQAEDLSHHFLAEALVNGYPPGDPDVLALTGVLRERNPAVRVIQLTDEDYLYIGADGATEAARVGRASVRQALVQAVLLSVGVFAPPTMGVRPVREGPGRPV
jgi:hypothetical protein